MNANKVAARRSRYQTGSEQPQISPHHAGELHTVSGPLFTTRIYIPRAKSKCEHKYRSGLPERGQKPTRAKAAASILRQVQKLRCKKKILRKSNSNGGEDRALSWLCNFHSLYPRDLEAAILCLFASFATREGCLREGCTHAPHNAVQRCCHLETDECVSE